MIFSLMKKVDVEHTVTITLPITCFNYCPSVTKHNSVLLYGAGRVSQYSS